MMKNLDLARRLGFCLLFVSLIFATPVMSEQDGDRWQREASDASDDGDALDPRLQAMAPRHRAFLEDVEPLITDEEYEVFLELTSGYRRDAFIRKFWDVRDPFPQTERNELAERWIVQAKKARELYGGLDSELAKVMLFFGEPASREVIDCEILRDPVEVWSYSTGAAEVRGYFTLIFVGPRLRSGVGQRIWYPRSPLSDLVRRCSRSRRSAHTA